MIARRGGRGGHAVSVRADTALLKFEDRGQATELSTRPVLRRFATATATSILRHTSTHNQTKQPATMGTQRTSSLAHSRYSHSTQSPSQGHLDE
eukprot:scaffold41832_cov68-Phaeocystis_antarctica.AAC.1